MRLASTLPQFTDDPDLPLGYARHAESVGLAGVFAFDHLWPLGNREGNVLASFPLLGALAQETSTIAVGTLVARVGLVPDAQLVAQLRTLDAIAGGRLVAGVGVGDKLSFAENDAYGVPAEDLDRRLERLVAVGRGLREAGVTVWFGGRHHRLIPLTVGVADALNMWGAPPDEVAVAAAGLGESGVEVTWGGQCLIGRDEHHAAELLAKHGTRRGLLHGTPDAVAAGLRPYAESGATLAVLSPLDAARGPEVPELLAEVAQRLH